MKRVAWAVAVIVVLVAADSAWMKVRNHFTRDEFHDRDIRVAQQEISRWQAKYAEAVTQAAKDGTVYIAARARVVTLRDTLRISDTVQVREYITRTDSALSACDQLRRSCLVLSEAADSTIHTYQYVNKWYIAEAAKQKRQARAWKIASGVLGGFIVWRVMR